MSAYASLLSLMHTINHINIHPRPQISLHPKQVPSLTQNLTFLQNFLERYSNGKDDDLETRIADAAYAAEDVIETHIVDLIQYGSASQCKSIVSVNFYQDLERVIQGMDMIKKEVILIIKEKIGAQHHDRLNESSFSTASVRRASIGQSKNRGGYFDDVLINEVLDKLTGQKCRLQIIPIVGMGGIGKTTFARNVYENPLIIQHFDIHAWVTISQEYNRRGILQVLCSETKVGKNDLGHFSEDELGEILYKHLCGRRYLVVMDDIWSIEAWDKVKSFFPNNNNRSRIMITTRLSNLAFRLGGTHNFQMRFLDDDKSWNLLSEIVFGKESGCPIELENIGKVIAKQCRELPLSIVVIGGLLAKSNMTRGYWDLCLREAQKQRFLCRLSQQDQYLDVAQGIDMERRICISKHARPQILHSALAAFSTRSLLMNRGIHESSALFSSKLVRVYYTFDWHVSDISFARVLFQKANLRYLSLKFNSDALSRFTLLSSLLWSLQTLMVIVPSTSDPIIAPFKIWETPLLRHVVLGGLQLADPPCGEDNFVLENLRTLTKIINFNCSEDVVKRIPNIKKLGIECRCYRLDGEEGLPNLSLNNLGRLQKLESFNLEISDTCVSDIIRSNLARNIAFPHSLKKLTLSGTMMRWEDLTAKIGSLPFLEVLRLHFLSCIGAEWETTEGQFCSLKILVISGCSDLKQWKTDNTHFPSLECLSLRFLRELEEIPSCIGDILTLKSIELVGCSISAEDSAERIKGEQQDNGNEDLQFLFVTLSVKGIDVELTKVLKIFNTIDLSSNNFKGSIPESISCLTSLRLLNLSHNSIHGVIPPALGRMTNLEQLDLSNNQLTGSIPQSLTSLTFLGDLDLSHNHLVGPIPQGNQFLTFSNESYAANSELCGFPLTTSCRDEKEAPSAGEDEEDDDGYMMGFTWKTVVIGYGCGIVLGFILGNILISVEKPRWLARFVYVEAAIILSRRKKRRRAVQGAR